MHGRLVTTVVLLLSTISLANAQSGFEAQIRGTITDPSGALVVGANVTLTNTSTNVPLTTKTDDKGLYTFKPTAAR